MPARNTKAAIDIETAKSLLPQTYYIMRGHIQAAFGLSRREIDALVCTRVFVAKYPFGKKRRARFERSQVIAAMRS